MQSQLLIFISSQFSSQTESILTRVHMVCFLSCFGFTKKRKRPKCCTNIISSNQVHGKYVPLDSDIASQFQHTQDSKISGSRKKENSKEQSSLLKVKKKVSFNLDVKTYEPLNYDDDIDDIVNFSEGEEETKWEFNEEETQRATMVNWHHQKDKITSYRYQNIQDFDDEEDETILDDIDSDDDIFYDDEESCDLDNDGNCNEGDRTTINDHQVTMGRRYADSVLNPVENLTQWKAIKAKESLQRRRQKGTIISEQENQVPQETTNFSHSKNLQNEIAVNASLANWLLTSNNKTHH